MDREQVTKNTLNYFDKLYHFKILSEENKALMAMLSQKIITLPADTELERTISKCILDYYQQAKNKNDLKAMANAEALIQKQNPVYSHDINDTKTLNLPVVVEEKPMVRTLSKKEVKATNKAAFINVAILLYGVLNIGLILAMALLRQ